MSMRFSGFSQLSLLTVAVVLAATSAILPSPSAQAESMEVMEEIVVTARKREETLQEVPVVVTVLTENAIDSQRIESIRDIGTIVPGMVASRTISGTSGFIYLRGVGTGSGNPAFDQAVAINIDGMGINSAQLMDAGMFDMRQIEVLKGPQALFYGKNSPGGVIAIHTNDPGDEFELELSGMYESVQNETTLRGIISGPLSDTLGARLAFGRTDINDSWVEAVGENRFEDTAAGRIQTAFDPGDHTEYEKSFALATLLWEPTDNFTAKLKFGYLEDNRTGPVYTGIQFVWCPYGAPQNVIYPYPAGLDCKADDKEIASGINPALNYPLKNGLHAGEDEGFIDNENDFASLTLTYEMDNGLTFTSVTGYFAGDEERYADSSFEAASTLVTTQRTELDQWSQELRLVSNFDGNVNFAMGAFYEDKEIDQSLDVNGGFLRYVPPLFPLVGNLPFNFGAQNPIQEGTSWSVFGQVIWDLSEQWTLAVGGRYSDEEKELEMRAALTATPLLGFPDVPWVPVPIAQPKNDWNNFSPEATLSYQYNNDIMFFASYREGFKSGGYDISYSGFRVFTAAPLDNVYNEELVDGFEVGMKSTLLDGTLRLNVTAYTYDYEDLQLSRFDGETISFSIFNGGKASIDGLEVETLWVTPVDGLTLTANVVWGSSEFDEFIAPCWAGQTIAMGCNSDPHPLTGNFNGTDKSGQSLPFASDLSAMLGLNYDTQVSDNWNLAFNFTASFKDDYNPTPEQPPEAVQNDSYWWINAGLSLYSTNDKWEVFVRGVNLTDETYNISGAAAPGHGDATKTGTNDATGLPDFIAYVQGGRQVNIGLTYRL